METIKIGDKVSKDHVENEKARRLMVMLFPCHAKQSFFIYKFTLLKFDKKGKLWLLLVNP